MMCVVCVVLCVCVLYGCVICVVYVTKISVGSLSFLSVLVVFSVRARNRVIIAKLGGRGPGFSLHLNLRLNGTVNMA